MDFYAKIEHEINRQKLSKTELAKKLGLTRTAVYKLTDKTAISTYFKIIEVLGMKPADFFKDQVKYKNHTVKSTLLEQSEDYNSVNYKEKYYETLEKLNLANERLLAFTDIKKEPIKKKK